MSAAAPLADPVLAAVLAAWGGLALAVGLDAHRTERPALRWAATVALVGIVGLVAYAVEGDGRESNAGVADAPDDAGARCASCGTELPEDARYCPDCGARRPK